mmetsp:Transcript_55730/g.158118  ORF Transcript_55730/g.158118 Transcript_55730/m.158118 type:complete len:206 (+) Transcript_55730:76-693(+)
MQGQLRGSVADGNISSIGLAGLGSEGHAGKGQAADSMSHFDLEGFQLCRACHCSCTRAAERIQCRSLHSEHTLRQHQGPQHISVGPLPENDSVESASAQVANNGSKRPCTHASECRLQPHGSCHGLGGGRLEEDVLVGAAEAAEEVRREAIQLTAQFLQHLHDCLALYASAAGQQTRLSQPGSRGDGCCDDLCDIGTKAPRELLQ